jgi:hypothetical protein
VGQRFFVREHDVESLSECGVEQIRRFTTRYIDKHRARDGVACDRRQGFVRRCAPTSKRCDQCAFVFLPRQRAQPSARQASRLEDISGTIHQADDLHA